MLASLRQGFAASTRRNLAIQKGKFLAFCTRFAVRPFPASLDTLCMYAQFLGNTFQSVDAIRNYIQGVKTLHTLKGLRTSQFDSQILSLLLRGLRRTKAHVTRQALPITPLILQDLHRQLHFHDTEDRVFWALCLLAFFSVFRKSNLVATSASTFHPRRQLLRRDIIVNQSSLWVRKRWSKTIQFGQRQLVVPVLSIPHSSLCPVTAYSNMCRVVPGQQRSPSLCHPPSGNLNTIHISTMAEQAQTYHCIDWQGSSQVLHTQFQKGWGHVCT